MSIAPPSMVGSVRVVGVGSIESLTRGRPSEFRHRGITLASRPSAIAALLEIGREPDSIVLVPSSLSEMPLTEFIDVLRSVAHVPVIAGLENGCPTSVVSELLEHGIAAAVALPVTPGRLAEAVQVARPAERPRDETIQIGALTFDEARHRVTWHGNTIPLTPKSFDLLRHMLEAHLNIVTLEELIHFVGHGLPDGGVRARAAIGRLRSAFADATPGLLSPIETVHRIGYRLAV